MQFLDGNHSPSRDNSRQQIIGELCLMPEVYFVLSEVLSGKQLAGGRVKRNAAENSNFSESIFASVNSNQQMTDSSHPTNEGKQGQEQYDSSSNNNPLGLASDVVDYFETMSKLRKEQQADKTEHKTR
jgi:hypothetical protein